MVKPPYCPVRGDIVWLDFDPQLGHEQRGRRPAVVVSHQSYNVKTDLALFCPITSKEKGYPFEIKVDGSAIKGCILSDQVKSLDWKLRNAELIERLSDEALDAVIERIELLIE